MSIKGILSVHRSLSIWNCLENTWLVRVAGNLGSDDPKPLAEFKISRPFTSSGRSPKKGDKTFLMDELETKICSSILPEYRATLRALSIKTVLLKWSATGTSLASAYFTKHIRSWTGAARSRLEVTINIGKSFGENSESKLDLQCRVESEIFDFPDYAKQCLHLLFVGLRCDISDLNNPRFLNQSVRLHLSQVF